MWGASAPLSVMPVLVTGIHAVRLHERSKALHRRPNSSCKACVGPHGVDARDKPGHDGRSLLMPLAALNLAPMGR